MNKVDQMLVQRRQARVNNVLSILQDQSEQIVVEAMFHFRGTDTTRGRLCYLLKNTV